MLLYQFSLFYNVIIKTLIINYNESAPIQPMAMKINLYLNLIVNFEPIFIIQFYTKKSTMKLMYT